ncbi:MAG TPA: hypothetical protein VGQ81_01900 [Acidobacteriota bacterium]|jgi:multisubunit Na+/H+ antiporter MnhB subunit|nr:hypothetical protein [Acidobacteriota bacterium]
MDTVSIVLLLTITLLLFVILLGPRKVESYSTRPQLPRWLVWGIRLAIALAVGRILVYLLSRYGYI